MHSSPLFGTEWCSISRRLCRWEKGLMCPQAMFAVTLVKCCATNQAHSLEKFNLIVNRCLSNMHGYTRILTHIHIYEQILTEIKTQGYLYVRPLYMSMGSNLLLRNSTNGQTLWLLQLMSISNHIIFKNILQYSYEHICSYRQNCWYLV